MVYTDFLDVLVNILFLLAGVTVIIATAVLFPITSKDAMSQEHKFALSGIRRVLTRIEILDTLTQHQLEELLFKLEKEKRALTSGYNSMTSTHKDVTKIKLLRLEEKIREVNTKRGYH